MRHPHVIVASIAVSVCIICAYAQGPVRLPPVDRPPVRAPEGPDAATVNKALDAALRPQLAKGIDVAALSRGEVLAKIADGTLAPEILAVNLVATPRDREQRNRMWSLQLYQGSVNLRLDGKFRKLDLPRAELEAVAKRLAAALAKADMGAMPRQLYHPTAMVGMGVSIRGRTDRIDLSADKFPYNLKQKRTHPKAQDAFDGLMREIETIHAQLARPRPTTRPADTGEHKNDATR